MKEKLITLDQYISDRNITLQRLHELTREVDEKGKGVSYARLASIKKTLNPTVDVQTISFIYLGTKKEFGDDALSCWKWLDLPKFWE